MQASFGWLIPLAVIAALLAIQFVVAARRRAAAEASAHLHSLRQSDAFKTSLLRAVSHDLTTPVTAIRIHTAALQRHAASFPEIAPAVAAIDEETARLHRRIDNLLTLARLDAGRFTPHPEPTPPADVFHAVEESLSLVFAARPVTIEVARNCPDAFVDPSLALEILVNLVENAHRAAPAGAPIELAAACVRDRVELEVRDRGPGVPEDSDVIQRGLGLEIARGLTAASNGTFELVRREGGGTIARVVLPAAVVGAIE
jgi:two-component system, OmpR family, sensor histidine kinase KdpD